MASSFAIYQLKIDELKSLIKCEYFMIQYKDIIDRDSSVILYVSKFHEIFESEIDDSEDRVSTLARHLEALSEDMIGTINDHAELQQFRKGISAEVIHFRFPFKYIY